MKSRLVWFFYALLMLHGNRPQELLSAEADSRGQITVAVFQAGESVANQTLILNQSQRLKTFADGTVVFEIEPGQHSLAVQLQSGDTYGTEFQSIADRTTHIVVNLPTVDGEIPDFDIENPVADEPRSNAGEIHLDPDAERLNFQGKVLSIDNRESIAGVQVYIRGLREATQTDESGKFNLSLPAGTYAISFVHPQFSSLSIEDLSIHENKLSQTFFLSPAGIKMEEFVVTAPHIKGSMASLLDERRSSSEVTDVISAEQMSKSGDSDAASALKRVTGLTVVDGKYIYIRGLGGRYSSALLNGYFLPSPNPLRREVPLDMFPTGVLESIVVQKSYSADLPGDFGGGNVLLRTKSLPDDFFVKVSLSTSKSDGDGKAYSYKGGDKDWLGFDDGTRKLPDVIANSLGPNEKLAGRSIITGKGFTDEQIEAFGEAFPRTYNTEEISLPINKGFSLSIGDRFKTSLFDIGYLSSLIYGDEWESSTREKSSYNLSGNVYVKDPYSTRTETERLVKLGGSFSLGVDIGKNHKVRSFVALLRRSVDQTSLEEGNNNDYDGLYRFSLLEWEEREILLKQLFGEHSFDFLNGTQLSWRVGGSEANRSLPDSRDYRYEFRSDVWRLASRNDGNERRYGELEDTNNEQAVDITIPFKVFSLPSQVKFGLLNMNRERDSKLRRYGFIVRNISADILAQSMDQIVVPENIGPTTLQLNEKTLITDNYVAEQELSAQYLLFNFTLFDRLDLSLGQRIEHSRQEVKTFDLVDPDQVVIAELDRTNRLPSFNATYRFSQKLQLRFGYSKTLARPDFRELSPSQYIDDDTDTVTKGNPDLVSTEIANFDTRIEYYPSSNESLSLGVFRKNFTNPIEIRAGSGENTFQNAESAFAYGAEFEFSKGLGFLYLNDFTLAGNYSYIVSEVTLGSQQGNGPTSIATSEQRPLQGQSPYILNLSLYYDQLDWGLSAALLYNRFGPRISSVGTQGRPDEYEQPYDRIDFVLSQSIADTLTAKLKVSDLLAKEEIRKQDDRTTLQKDKNREYSLSLSASF